MEFFTNKSVVKKIVIAIVLVTLFNFISPTVSSASAGIGILFEPIMDLLCTAADLVLEKLQEYFVGSDEIAYNAPHDDDFKIFHIYYSPGIIFSNKVAGLKTNFINADSTDNETVEIKKHEFKHKKDVNLKEMDKDKVDDDEYFFDFMQSKLGKNIYNKETDFMDMQIHTNSSFYDFEATEVDYLFYWTHEGKDYVGILIDVELSDQDVLALAGTTALGAIVTHYILKKAVSALIKLGVIHVASTGGYVVGEAATPIPAIDGILGYIIGAIIGFVVDVCILIFGNESTDGKVFVYEEKVTTKEVTKESSALLLKDTVATWYKALRAIALVGLLSILVYVGIRILISSTGQEKAKYKKMLVDWLAALCLLFILHYIMMFITVLVQKIIDVLQVNLIGPNGEDILITGLRSEAEMINDFRASYAQTLMYIVLVIYSVIFTVQYLKRFFYLAFFTLIAPLVALTYPLDKIKDGKAQAFSVWLKEYMFNSLIQPVHLLLYIIFVDSAIVLVSENPLYAIVAIGFIVPAEKFFRKMFGFEQAESAGQSGTMAAAGGALIMNAINKMGSSSGKHAAGGKGGTEGSGSSGGTSVPRYIPSPNDSNSQTSQSSSGGGDSSSSSGRTQAGQQSNSGQSSGQTQALGQTINPAGAAGARSFRNGARTLKGHYLNKGNLVKGAKGLGRMARKIGVGAVGAATLGTVGLAAGIATGDLGNAFKYGLAGAGVGYAGANNLGDKAVAFEKKNREIFKEGALGTEEYNTRNSIKELTNDNDFNNVCKHLGVKSKAEKEQLIRQFHKNGITSASDIKKAMNAGASTNNINKEQIIAAAKIRKQATQYGMKRKDIEEMIKNQPNISDTDVKNAMDLIDML